MLKRGLVFAGGMVAVLRGAPFYQKNSPPPQKEKQKKRGFAGCTRKAPGRNLRSFPLRPTPMWTASSRRTSSWTRRPAASATRTSYEQWKSSMHHFASFNNQFYRKSIEYMQSVAGPQPSKWCAGCHDHAVFFNGRFEKPIKDQIDTPEAHAGLACTSCHSIVHVDSTMGNGGFTIEYPPLHELVTSKNKYIREFDDFMTYLNPEPHRKTFMKPFMRAGFGGVLLHLPQSAPRHAGEQLPLVPRLQRLRQLAGQRLWRGRAIVLLSAQGTDVPRLPHAAGAFERSRQSQRRGAFAPLPRRQHGGDHANRDHAQMGATERFLKSGFITVDIFAVSPVDENASQTAMVRRAGEGPQLMTGSAVGEEAEQSGNVIIREVGKLSAPIDRMGAAVMPGTTAKVDVVVRTRKIGHFFPGGTLDSFDIWLELQAKDAGRQDHLLERTGRRRGQGSGRAGRAFLPRLPARWRRQPDQQAQRLAGALRALRARDPARRRRRGALSREDTEGRERADHAERQAELSQVLALLHAVRLRRATQAGPGSAGD